MSQLIHFTGSEMSLVSDILSADIDFAAQTRLGIWQMIGGAIAALGSITIAARIQPAFATAAGVNRALGNRSRSLPLQLGQNLGDGLLRNLRLGSLRWQRYIVNLHNNNPKTSWLTNPIITMAILLHKRNEESFNSSVLKYKAKEAKMSGFMVKPAQGWRV